MFNGSFKYDQTAGAGRDCNPRIPIIFEKNSFAAPRSRPLPVHIVQRGHIFAVGSAIAVWIRGVAIDDTVNICAVRLQVIARK